MMIDWDFGRGFMDSASCNSHVTVSCNRFKCQSLWCHLIFSFLDLSHHTVVSYDGIASLMNRGNNNR